MTANDNRRLIRVGVFVVLTLVLLVGMVGLVGRSRNLFSRKAVLHTSFENISGLVVGAPVRLGGVDVGIVQSIQFDRDLKVKKVRVVLSVHAKYLERIRTDSTARLSSKGLLGDMIINITVGSPEYAALKSGDSLTSHESEGLAEMTQSVQSGIGELRTLVGTVEKRVETVLSDEVTADFKRTVHSAANVMERVEKGGGLLHDVIYEPELSRHAAVLVKEAAQSAAQLNLAMRRVDGILAAVEKGQGTLHGLLYRDDAGKLLGELQRAATEFAAVATEVRSGKGALHTLIYESGENGKSNLVADLSATARILRALAEEAQQGKGTVGGLLRDPSVYQDLKTILGNVKRNALLKALIRSAIQSEGLKRDR